MNTITNLRRDAVNSMTLEIAGKPYRITARGQLTERDTHITIPSAGDIAYTITDMRDVLALFGLTLDRVHTVDSAPVVIEVTKRLSDYHAQIKGHPEAWARGVGPDAAVGGLVRSFPGSFGVEVTWLEPGK